MARSDLIISLVKAGLNGDAAGVRETAEAIAADERAKRHTGLADRIARAIHTTASLAENTGTSGARSRIRDGSGGISRREPTRSINDLYLDTEVRAACDELIEEQRRADVLRAHGMEPRHRLLLVGPPGNGKTTLAEALAYELALPLLSVRYDAVVTSYLGETAQRLRRLFEFVRTEPCLLFFDEFDAIGKERGDLHETGEISVLSRHCFFSWTTYRPTVCLWEPPTIRSFWTKQLGAGLSYDSNWGPPPSINWFHSLQTGFSSLKGQQVTRQSASVKPYRPRVSPTRKRSSST